jgi:hypothetical protein
LNVSTPLKKTLNSTYGRKIRIRFPVERITKSSIAGKAGLFAGNWFGNVFATRFDCATKWNIIHLSFVFCFLILVIFLPLYIGNFDFVGDIERLHQIRES